MSAASVYLETGKLARVVDPSSSDYDIETRGGTITRKLMCRRLVMGSAGTLRITGEDGTAVDLPDLGAGTVWDIKARSLVAAGSTATSVVVIW